jgi:hypothetical protein
MRERKIKRLFVLLMSQLAVGLLLAGCGGARHGIE